MNPLYRPLAALLLLAIALPAAAGQVRTWTDSSGKYSIKASLIAFNDRQVVIQRESDNELGTVPIESLSKADQEYLKSQEAIKAADEVTGAMQRWTLNNGLEVVGRLVTYGSKQIVLRRSRGNIYVNDRRLTNLPAFYQQMIPLIVAHAGNDVRNINMLTQWLASRRGGPETFTVDGVMIEFENGDEYGIPFFMFSEKDLEVLQPGWERWLAANKEKDPTAREQEDFQLQTQAAEYQHNQAFQRQIAQMQLGLQAVQAGITSVWEVTLYPEPGNSGPPLWVTGFARDSRSASLQAMAKHPGYIVGPVRRVSN